jgi:hypothetical protein
MLVLPDGAAAYVPWTIERGVPLPHEGAYGHTVSEGWSLRGAMMHPATPISRGYFAVVRSQRSGAGSRHAVVSAPVRPAEVPQPRARDTRMTRRRRGSIIGWRYRSMASSNPKLGGGSDMASVDVPAGRPVAVPAAPAVVAKPTYITGLTLAFMTTASIASLRSAPTMAVYGLTCVFLYLVPA